MTAHTRLAILAVAALAAIASSSAVDAKQPKGHYVGGFGNFPGVWIPDPATGTGKSGTGIGTGPEAVATRTIKLACIVGGTPVEFPNDIWITNTTGATLVKGTALTFAVPSIGVKGSFILPSNVAPGTQVQIADIFGGAQAGAPCTVKLV